MIYYLPHPISMPACFYKIWRLKCFFFFIMLAFNLLDKKLPHYPKFYLYV